MVINEFNVLDKKKVEVKYNPEKELQKIQKDNKIVIADPRRYEELKAVGLLPLAVKAINEFLEQEKLNGFHIITITNPENKALYGLQIKYNGGEEIKEKVFIEKPQLLLDGDGRSISDLSNDVSELLKNKNVLFFRPNSRQIVEIGKIKLKNTKQDFYTGFREIKDKRFITFIEKYVDVGRDNLKYGWENKSLSPIKSSIILNSEILEQSLPQIERLFPLPIPIIYNGKLTTPCKEFDERFSSWRNNDSPEITEGMDLEEAKGIIDKILKEFCFLKEQDKTNAIAGLLTPFLRGMYESFNTRTPIFFYLGNRERVGKDYLAGITGLIYDGQSLDDTPISSGDNSGNNNEELRKKITSALISGRKRMHFANNKGYINNAILEQVSTSKYYSDRLLGRNDLVSLPNEMDFSLSGNVGVTYTPDFANRCRFVNLFLAMEDVNSREFKTPLLHEWILENRDVIVSAMFCLVKNWIDNGKPKGSVPFASFPNWATVCGGVMESAGYDSPCIIDKDSIAMAGDSETADMKQLFEVGFSHHPNEPIKKNKIVWLLNEYDLFSFLELDKKSGQIAFAKKLRKFIGRELSGIKLGVVDNSVRPARQEFLFTK